MTTQTDGIELVYRGWCDADTQELKGCIDRAEFGRLRAKDKRPILEHCGSLSSLAAEIVGLEIHQSPAAGSGTKLAHEFLGKKAGVLWIARERPIEERVEIGIAQGKNSEPGRQGDGWAQGMLAGECFERLGPCNQTSDGVPHEKLL